MHTYTSDISVLLSDMKRFILYAIYATFNSVLCANTANLVVFYLIFGKMAKTFWHTAPTLF